MHFVCHCRVSTQLTVIQLLSVMTLAIMGTNAAVAGQPKSGLEERACFCKYVFRVSYT